MIAFLALSLGLIKKGWSGDSITDFLWMLAGVHALTLTAVVAIARMCDSSPRVTTRTAVVSFALGWLFLLLLVLLVGLLAPSL